MTEAANGGKTRTDVPQNQIEESLASVREALTGLKFGGIQLTIHEGRVVQIDVTEKRRLQPN